MSLAVRRIVVANDASGKSVKVSDETIPAASRELGVGITGTEMWSTAQMPVDNDTSADHEQRSGFIKQFNEFNWVGSGGGTAFRITEWAPGHAKFTHRTQTTDYDVVLAGEIDLTLDRGKVVHLRAGDVVILRGGTHTWHNTGEIPAITAFILIDALPVNANGEMLQPLFSADRRFGSRMLLKPSAAPERNRRICSAEVRAWNHLSVSTVQGSTSRTPSTPRLNF